MHKICMTQVRDERVRIEMEIREDDTAAFIDHRKPGCSSRAVVFHEGLKRLPGRWLIVTKRKGKVIFELVHAQRIECVLFRALEDGLDHRKPHAPRA